MCRESAPLNNTNLAPGTNILCSKEEQKINDSNDRTNSMQTEPNQNHSKKRKIEENEIELTDNSKGHDISLEPQKKPKLSNEVLN